MHKMILADPGLADPNHVKGRVLRLFGLLVLTAFLVLPSSSQHLDREATLQATEWSISTTYSQLTNSSLYFEWGDNSPDYPSASLPVVRLSGRVPLEDLLPQTTPDSEIEFFQAAAGVRVEEHRTRASWSVALVDLVLQRASWSGAVRLLNLSTNTSTNHERTWFEVGTGPGLHIKRKRTAFSVRAQIFGGRKSAEVPRNYSGLPTLEARSGSGWHGGGRVDISARIRSSLTTSWRVSHSRFSNGNLAMTTIDSRVLLSRSQKLGVAAISRMILVRGWNRHAVPTETGIELAFRI